MTIGLPVVKVILYDEQEIYIHKAGYWATHVSQFNILDYDDKLKKLIKRRLRINISSKSIVDIENKNDRYKRAINFYNNSFLISDIGVQFTLLFSSIEALFNLNGKNIKKTISKYTSKILFLDTVKENLYYKKIKDFYNKRSKYIHGNISPVITNEDMFDLREIVREILLIYWYLSLTLKIPNAKDMLLYLDNHNHANIGLQPQIFIKSLHMQDYKTFYNEVKSGLLNKKLNN